MAVSLAVSVDECGAMMAALISQTEATKEPHAAGALVSTVDDLHRWNRALHGGKLLGKPTHFETRDGKF